MSIMPQDPGSKKNDPREGTRSTQVDAARRVIAHYRDIADDWQALARSGINDDDTGRREAVAEALRGFADDLSEAMDRAAAIDALQ